MNTVKYYDSFIPLPENEIKSPMDAFIFFSKALLSEDEFPFLMEGYRVISKNDYRLTRIVYNIPNDINPDNQKLILSTHKKNMLKSPFLYDLFKKSITGSF